MSDVRARGFERRTTVPAALAILARRTAPLDAETVPIEQAAGRVAAADVRARIAVPHFARSMMDGYAVVAEATLGASPYHPQPHQIIGTARPGRPAQLAGPVEPGQAVNITTGAPMPAGADAVVMVERTEPMSATRDGGGAVAVTAPVSPGKHVGTIGEDIESGSVVIAKGRRIRPQDAGVAASAGIGALEMVRRPLVRIMITGDELLAPGQLPTGPHIVDSNSLVLAALIDRDGGVVETIDRTPDEPAAVRESMTTGTADVVLVSGGSSVGPEDHAPVILAEVGQVAVHGVAMRPASPAGFGFIPDGASRERIVFLLPGNPVSCLCAYEFFAGPTIRTLGGRSRHWPHPRRQVRAASKLVSVLGRTDYMRVILSDDGVHPLMTSGASILSSTTRADGAIIVPDEHEGHAAGELVEVLLYGDPEP
ncbi:MAG: molybdopterin molybdenumtransferase MoeA [Deltaproteobacteria bacterium]|nr:MAG: molybdopterin molybdenumtransferase MoeA [Deltaproteobacteria bacterium]